MKHTVKHNTWKITLDLPIRRVTLREKCTLINQRIWSNLETNQKSISCDTKMKLTAEPQAPDIQLTPDYNSPNKSCLTWCMAFLFAEKFSESESMH